jgi:rRNA maturation protein Rpf1
MQVTTSRDPSAKARRLGKALASFLSIPYANRGKQSPGDDDTWLVVVEDHGNPRGLVKRAQGSQEQLLFKMVLEPVKGRSKKLVPVVTGKMEEALPIARFFELEWQESLAQPSRRALVVASGEIDFVDENEAKFRLKIC